MKLRTLGCGSTRDAFVSGNLNQLPTGIPFDEVGIYPDLPCVRVELISRTTGHSTVCTDFFLFDLASCRRIDSCDSCHSAHLLSVAFLKQTLYAKIPQSPDRKPNQLITFRKLYRQTSQDRQIKHFLRKNHFCIAICDTKWYTIYRSIRRR